jgi:hypothetical protein
MKTKIERQVLTVLEVHTKQRTSVSSGHELSQSHRPVMFKDRRAAIVW